MNFVSQVFLNFSSRKKQQTSSFFNFVNIKNLIQFTNSATSQKLSGTQSNFLSGTYFFNSKESTSVGVRIDCSYTLFKFFGGSQIWLFSNKGESRILAPNQNWTKYLIGHPNSALKNPYTDTLIFYGGSMVSI